MSWINKAQELLIKNHTVTLAGNTMVGVDGTRYKADKLASFLVETYEKELGDSAIAQIYKLLNNKDNREFNSLLNNVRKEISRPKTSKLPIQQKNFKYNNLALITDIVTGENRTFNTKMDRLVDLDVDTWLDGMGKEAKGEITRILGTIKYNPRTKGSKALISHEGQEVYQFNSHVTPEWRMVGVVNPEPHPFFKLLLDHLFTTHSKRFVLNWVRNMLVSRNQTALLLVSNMGTGKGVFCDICEKLVGTSNFQKQTDGIKKNQFSGELRDTTLAHFDEYDLDDLGRERLKFWLNNTVTLEFKGVNVKKSFDNYTSFIVSNNHISENKLLPNDRRFSAPDMTQKKLLEVFSQEMIDDFITALNDDPSVVANIGWWIIKECEAEEYTEFSAYKGEWYYYLCINSLEEWKKFIIERITSRERKSYSINDLKYDYEEMTGNRLFPGLTKMNTFLETYLDRDEEIIGELGPRGKKPYILPTKKYLPKITDFDDEAEFNAEEI